MNRLITFGCSHTRGEGVDDPSTESWPAYLAKNLELECVNLGKDGISNKFIQHAVHTFDFRPDDVVVILWTYPVRYDIFKSPTEFLNMIPMKKGELNNVWYENFHTDYNAFFESKVTIHQVNSYLQDKYITVYNLVINKNLYLNLLELIDFNHISVYFNNFLNNKKYPKGHNDHAGHLANKFYAKEIHKHIYTHGQKEK